MQSVCVQVAAWSTHDLTNLCVTTGPEGSPVRLDSGAARPKLPLLDGPVDTEMPFLEPPSASKDDVIASSAMAELRRASWSPGPQGNFALGDEQCNDSAMLKPGSLSWGAESHGLYSEANELSVLKQLSLKRESNGAGGAAIPEPSSSGGCLRELEILAAVETSDFMLEQQPGGENSSSVLSLEGILASSQLSGLHDPLACSDAVQTTPAPQQQALGGFELGSPPMEEDTPARECSSLIYRLDQPTSTPLLSTRSSGAEAGTGDEEVTGPRLQQTALFPLGQSDAEAAASLHDATSLAEKSRSMQKDQGGEELQGQPALAGIAEAVSKKAMLAADDTDLGDMGHLRIRAFRPSKQLPWAAPQQESPVNTVPALPHADMKPDAGNNADTSTPGKVKEQP